jgi:hypothetical protein
MPQLVMKQLWREQAEVKQYAVHWANCIDYALGIDELLKRRGFSQFTHELLKSGRQQTKAIVSLLLDGDRANPFIYFGPISSNRLGVFAIRKLCL